MPIIKIGEDKFPEWSEIENIIIKKDSNEKNELIKNNSAKAVIFICNGECEIEETHLKKNDIKFLTSKNLHIKNASQLSYILLIGNWGDELGNSGFFKINSSNEPKNIGDPTNYLRSTEFDNHFHDCDEYWIILEGKGLAVSEGIKYFLRANVCLATKMGEHHDLPIVVDEIEGIYFETTLRGKKRKGHLWNHTHGI